ncbi:hypothetical protein AX15_002571 [Amanita polypyramis BW_CC]|nr:hypothetical protein AX15_002571 [Amanita polypyramis BW_CC]
MPVPVPRISKPPTHPVVKKHNTGALQPNPFQNLTRTLPVSPTGPPPSFGTREQWIESLPSWRRQKPRRIWEDDNTQLQLPAAQDFPQGLTVAGNAAVIKGERVQACIPPQCTMLKSSQSTLEYLPVSSVDSATDDEMHFDLPQWKWDPYLDADYMCEDSLEDFVAPNPSPISIEIDVSNHTAHSYERGAFSPVLEEESPGFGSNEHEAETSPLEPITPFCEFVDKAVAGVQPSNQTCGTGLTCTESLMPLYDKDSLLTKRDSSPGPIGEQPKPPIQPSVSEEFTNSAAAYKKLAEPLAEWMANFVWKVCTTGVGLPSNYVNHASIPIARFLDSPPRNLAPSIHSILLSTLLQPSAAFLALWYIVQLPVYCGSIALGSDHVKELHFRKALFGDPRISAATGDTILNLSPMDESMPFRLMLLGCMLANKWLDDHTFSNKTWHSISNVPIYALNELEILALDLFSYNLSVPSEKWFKWMEDIRSYHLSSIPPSHIQPISRPSSNPHLIIHKVIEDIIQTPLVTGTNAVPQPAFIGLEERKKERLEKEQAMDEIDLDEDGPLREEYLPRRRSNGSSSNHRKERALSSGNSPQSDVLPPPAKWSPSGDEPIFRARQRTNGNYVAVQAPEFHVWSAPYLQLGDPNYQDGTWTYSNVVPAKLPTGYGGYEVPNYHPSSYFHYSYAPLVPMIHVRTHSLSHDQNNSQTHGHTRSYSHNCFDQRWSNAHMADPSILVGKEAIHWYATDSQPYVPPAYAYHPGVIHQPTWVRT